MRDLRCFIGTNKSLRSFSASRALSTLKPSDMHIARAYSSIALNSNIIYRHRQQVIIILGFSLYLKPSDAILLKDKK